MLTLLQPIWLLAYTGIIVPIVIHLWHVKQGKTLKVGSLAFLQQSSKQQSTSLKITDWLLLLIRCLLIILLALLLAKPQWQSQPKPNEQKAWLVLDANDPLTAYHHFKPSIDSLLAGNNELHLLQQGFPKFDLKDTNSFTKDSRNSQAYWLLYQQLLSTNKGGYVFTDRQVQHFAGTATATNTRFKWISYTSTDTANKWLTSAYKTYDDSVIVSIANSTPKGTSIENKTLTFSNGIQGDIAIKGQVATLNTNTIDSINIDTSTLVIAIYANQFTEDANYVKAALEAIKKVSKRNMVISVASNANQLPKQIDWLFWLSDNPIAITTTTTHIVQYQAGNVAKQTTWLRNTDIGIKQSITNHTDIPIWQDGFGNNLLAINQQQPNIYKLYTHFNPSWNDFVWNDNFPSLLSVLLFTEPNTNSKDIREIDANVLHNIDSKTAQSHIDYTTLKDLSAFIWLLAFALLVVERWLSFTTKNSIA